MTCDFEFHPDVLAILPSLYLLSADCDDCGCERAAWSFQFGWLLWTVAITWTTCD